VLTAIFAVLAGQTQEAAQGEGMLPDLPVVAASETIEQRFSSSDEAVLQVVVRSDGGSLVGADGYFAATRLEAAIRDHAHDRLSDVDGRPAVITWMFPVQPALAASDPAGLDDGQIRTSYLDTMQTLPVEHAGMAEALLPQDADLATADRALAFLFLDTDGLAEDWGTYFDQMLAIQTDLAEVVASVELPGDISAEAFSDVLLYGDADGFDAEIARLFGGAFVVIVLILAFVYWVRPQAGLTRTRSGRRSLADLLLSMAAIVMAILWMTGAAVLLGPGYLDLIGGMTEFTQVIPILLIGLGVDYAIHLTSRYREEVGAGADVATSIRGAIATVGAALVLATVTTA
jgi:hypothetical protein